MSSFPARCICVLGVFLTACTSTGVQFGDVRLNVPLPDDFKNRTLYPNTSVLKYEIAELAGHVLYQDGTTAKPKRGRRYVAADYTPVAKAPQDGQLYVSKIDRGAASQGSYLAFSADLAESSVEEVQIEDVATVLIPSEKIPLESLIAEGLRAAADGARAFYVQGVVLTAIRRQQYERIDAHARGVVGDTFGLRNSVFNERAGRATDFCIGLESIDLVALAQHADFQSVSAFQSALHEPDVREASSGNDEVRAAVLRYDSILRRLPRPDRERCLLRARAFLEAPPQGAPALGQTLQLDM